MIRQNRKIQFIILFVLVCLVGTMSIAYAILSTTINITGNTEVIASSWNVHFANINVNPGSVNPTKTPTITDSKTIDFSVNLNKPGDFYKFTVDIVNEGSIDAMIDNVIKSPDLTSEQAKYIKYEIEYINGQGINSKQLLSSGETKTISVLLSYRTDLIANDLPSTSTTLNLSIQLNYIQADTTSTEITTSPKKISIKSGDLNTVGSEICIGEECFYLISNDGYKVTMLAKYNLYVGRIIKDKYFNNESLENPTGIQDETAIGLRNDSQGNNVFPFVAISVYSSTNYWWDNEKNVFKDKYLVDFEFNGNSFLYVYDSNSILYSYLENYKNYLESFNVIVNDSRIIKFSDLFSLGCNLEKYRCSNAPSWVYSTSYWTGVSSGSSYVNTVTSSGIVEQVTSYSAGHLGVRPVVEIPLTEF